MKKFGVIREGITPEQKNPLRDKDAAQSLDDDLVRDISRDIETRCKAARDSKSSGTDSDQ